MVALKIRPFEPLLPYLSRLAVASHTPIAQFLQHLGYSREPHAHDRFVEYLAQYSGNAIAKLRASSARGKGHLTEIWGEVFRAADLARSPRLCPSCVLEDQEIQPGFRYGRAWHRLVWMHKDFEVCPIHGNAIVSFPSQTFHFDFSTAVARHQQEIVALASQNVDVSQFDRYLQMRLSGDKSIPFIDALPMHLALGLLERLGTIAIHGDLFKETRLRSYDRSVSLRVGFDLAAEGEMGVQHFLERNDRRIAHEKRIVGEDGFNVTTYLLTG